jgi:hypothetical protein
MNRNLMVVVAALVLNSSAALAEDKNPVLEAKVQAQVQEEMRLAKINALLVELAKEKALQIDERGIVSLKQSVREQLLDRGRLNAISAGNGVVCE